MPCPYSLLLSILTILVSRQVDCANILVIDCLATHSHAIWFDIITTLLAKGGHQVTVLSPDQEKHRIPNRTTYTMETSYEDNEYENTTLDTMRDYWLVSATQSYRAIWDWNLNNCRKQFKSNGLKRFMRDFVAGGAKVDLIIREATGGECFLPLIHLLKYPPVIAATPYPNFEPSINWVGGYDNPSYVPHGLSGYTDHMNFFQRAHNIYISAYYKFMRRFHYLPKMDRLSREMFGNGPHVEILDDHVDLSFANYHPVLDYPKPTVPAFIGVPGLQLKPVQPLPEDIQSFLDGATEGAIIFTFGSSLHTSNMSPAYRAMFFQVFGSMKQRIIWKWELEIPEDKPDNVMLARWVPQADILGHRNTLAFISHCGQAGVQEAVYHAVPVLAIPFLIDQFIYADKLENWQVAIQMSYGDLTVERVRRALDKLIEPQYGYKERMRKLSAIFRDTPQKSSDKIVYWVNYVLTHGGSHLIPVSKQLTMIQYCLLDVMACVLLTPIVLVYLTKFLFWLARRKGGK